MNCRVAALSNVVGEHPQQPHELSEPSAVKNIRKRSVCPRFPLEEIRGRAEPRPSVLWLICFDRVEIAVLHFPPSGFRLAEQVLINLFLIYARGNVYSEKIPIPLLHRHTLL